VTTDYNAELLKRSDRSVLSSVVITKNTTVYTRFRSTSFTPTNTVYVLASGADVECVASRVVILQSNATSITATETQIEVGGYNVTLTNLAASPWTTGKMWVYDSTKWDGTCAWYVEAFGWSNGTKSGLTVILQQDDGAYSWSDHTTVFNASTSTTKTMSSRVAFSSPPISGRRYQVKVYRSSTKATVAITGCRIVCVQTGTPITKLETVHTVDPQIYSTTGLKPALIAHYSDTTEWDGVTVTRYHEIDTGNTSLTAAKLQSDPLGTPADVTNSLVTATGYCTRGASALTMPSGTPALIAMNITDATVGVAHSKIISQIVISASSIKTVLGLARASIKTVQGLAIASVKNILGLS
jgi:hypothetical protein